MEQKIKSNHKRFKKKQEKAIYSKFENKSKDRIELEKQSYLESLSENLKLPADLLMGVPVLTVTGSSQLCLENYKGIIEYTGEIIRIQTKKCRIHIEGKNLNIDYFTDDEMRISGKIMRIEYC
ncbi:YabP/YqfC family sporulation protein [[Clostridium] polysaccharolyticum]|jgi:sporulation protein YqfC|uniref:Sporulation protein YqfC n=1 Tax=[Clostridium] polysaccharolyticum TaxID=29364 RepID=A0A1I0AW49_9FIRM|nr:YabP/YqfC family sporulation protein [[Clostridium] polysaccharolyticum]SES98604.1 sporulation protein YqfC [[Clostridium] polysaccharolyticum]